jgi:hypothetical protein
MTTRNIYDLAQTWNDGATTFTAIKMNVTDTASASASKLLDLQVGGTSMVYATKFGQVYAHLKDNATNAVLLNGNHGFGVGTDSNMNFRHANTYMGRLSSSGLEMAAGKHFAFQTGNLGSGTDLILIRDAANTLAQRNGTAAQAFNIYNKYTDASNHERGFMRWVGDVFEIGAEAAGTGTVRNIKLFTGSLGQILFSHSGAGNRGVRIHSTNSFSVLQFTNPTTGETTGAGTILYQNALNYVIENQSSGGAISIQPNTGGIKITSLPTSDPSVSGQIWNDSGTLKISAG